MFLWRKRIEPRPRQVRALGSASSLGYERHCIVTKALSIPTERPSHTRCAAAQEGAFQLRSVASQPCPIGRPTPAFSKRSSSRSFAPSHNPLPTPLALLLSHHSSRITCHCILHFSVQGTSLSSRPLASLAQAAETSEKTLAISSQLSAITLPHRPPSLGLVTHHPSRITASTPTKKPQPTTSRPGLRAPSLELRHGRTSIGTSTVLPAPYTTHTLYRPGKSFAVSIPSQ